MKKAAITGANTGIGYETALQLAKENFQVIMLCRSKEKGEKAQKEIIEKSGNKYVELIVVDLASLKSIQQAAEKMMTHYPAIDVLINNAGVFSLKKEYTVDGFEKMIGVNYIGHFYLTKLLIPLLKKVERARIVVVSSNAYKMVHFDLSDLQPESRFSIAGNYGRSKLMTLLFAKELSKRLEDTNITVNLLHPGAVATSMGVNRKTGFGKTVYKFLKPFFKTPKEGAQTSIYLATSEEVKDSTGQFFIDSKPAPIKGLGKDEGLARQLFEQTDQLVIEKCKILKNSE